MRTIRYKEIAAALRDEITGSTLAPGALLPSEAELGEAFSASRVTIRKALEVLRDDGLVESRQGYGWMVSAPPLRQNLDHLETMESQLAAAGKSSSREVLGFGFVSMPPEAADALEGDQVLEVKRLSVIDTTPFALVTVWCAHELGAGLSLEDVQRSSFLDQLDVEIGGATQTIGADVANSEVASLLDVPEGSPLLVVKRVTFSSDGAAVLVSRHQFPAHVTEFVVDLPSARAASTAAPAELRLLR